MATQNVPPPAYQDSPQVSNWPVVGWRGPEGHPRAEGRARPTPALLLSSLGGLSSQTPWKESALGKALGSDPTWAAVACIKDLAPLGAVPAHGLVPLPTPIPAQIRQMPQPLTKGDSAPGTWVCLWVFRETLEYRVPL